MEYCAVKSNVCRRIDSGCAYMFWLGRFHQPLYRLCAVDYSVLFASRSAESSMGGCNSDHPGLYKAGAVLLLAGFQRVCQKQLEAMFGCIIALLSGFYASDHCHPVLLGKFSQRMVVCHTLWRLRYGRYCICF